jgi:hypothetical protein
LRPFCDIAETIHHFGSEIDWATVIERAIARKWQRGVYLTLQLAKEMIEADVPAFVLENLRPGEAPGVLMDTVRFKSLPAN